MAKFTGDHWRFVGRCCAVTSILTLMAGCTAIPSDGPTSFEIRSGAEVTVEPVTQPVSYVTIRLSPLVVSSLHSAERTPRFSRLLLGSGRADVRVNVGDRLSITIFEAKEGGLFIPLQASARPGNFVALPTLEVPGSGIIEVPYAGAVRAAGKSTDAIHREIVARLRDRAIEPQVVVAVSDRNSSVVSVLGDVSSPTRMIIDPSGLRILDAIARAGGAKFPSYESVVTVQRGSRSETASLALLIRSPADNIQLQSRDVVTVTRAPRVFLAFGATVSPQISNQFGRRLTFDDANMSLSEGVAKAGGLLDSRADPMEVFLYRMEAKSTLERLGVDVSRHAGHEVPTVYTVNMQDPGGLFLAGQFYMRDKDALFVAAHPMADVAKFINLFAGAGTLAGQAGVAARGF